MVSEHLSQAVCGSYASCVGHSEVGIVRHVKDRIFMLKAISSYEIYKLGRKFTY